MATVMTVKVRSSLVPRLFSGEGKEPGYEARLEDELEILYRAVVRLDKV